MSDKKTDYICKSTQNIREASLLIEDGYEYVTDIGGTKLFRKRNPDWPT